MPAPTHLRVVVARKAVDVDDAARQTANMAALGRTTDVVVAQSVELDAATYADLKGNLLEDRPALYAGLRGWTAFCGPDGTYLLVDTQGYDYARYVALPVPDNKVLDALAAQAGELDAAAKVAEEAYSAVSRVGYSVKRLLPTYVTTHHNALRTAAALRKGLLRARDAAMRAYRAEQAAQADKAKVRP